MEFPDQAISSNTSDVFFRLQLAGLTPIITHPERNSVLTRNSDRICEWVLAGAYVQVTAASLTGRFGKTAQRVAHDLLRKNCVHFIATDAHDLISRPPMLRESYDLVKSKY